MQAREPSDFEAMNAKDLSLSLWKTRRNSRCCGKILYVNVTGLQQHYCTGRPDLFEHESLPRDTDYDP